MFSSKNVSKKKSCFLKQDQYLIFWLFFWKIPVKSYFDFCYVSNQITLFVNRFTLITLLIIIIILFFLYTPNKM